MKAILLLVGVLSCLSGCTYAAKQVLGEQATPVNPTKAQRLEVAKVFRVRGDGTSYQICKADLKNRAIQAISIEVAEDSNEVVTDKVTGEDIAIVFPGIPKLRMPYYKTQVTGYTVRKASWPADGDFYSYFYKGVGDNCRKLIKQGNVLIVEAEARAKKSAQVFKGPIDEFGLGTGKLEGIGKEYTIRAPANVTFGVIAARP